MKITILVETESDGEREYSYEDVTGFSVSENKDSDSTEAIKIEITQEDE